MIMPTNLVKWGINSPTRPRAAFVRMRHPTEPGTYYSQTGATWVKRGWTTWPIEEWIVKFGNKEDNFNWEFFGYRITLYADDELPVTGNTQENTR